MGELKYAGRVSSSCSTRGIRRVPVKRYEHHVMRKSWWVPEYVNNNK